jgi:hypothetical protein
MVVKDLTGGVLNLKLYLTGISVRAGGMPCHDEELNKSSLSGLVIFDQSEIKRDDSGEFYLSSIKALDIFKLYIIKYKYEIYIYII